MARVGTAPGARPGGRSAQVRLAVMRATLGALAGGDPGAISIPAIARAAGVSPSTIYRRWPARADLITEALGTLAEVTVPLSSADSLRADLIAFAEDLSGALARPDLRALARTLVGHDAAEADEVRRSFWERRLGVAGELVDAAKARSELPAEVPYVELMERIGAPIWMRALVTGLPIDGDWIERLVDDTVAGISRGQDGHRG